MLTRNEAETELVRVDSLSNLDALVGKYLTGETPRIHWEDANTHFQFESMEEAIDALHDPYFQQFVQREASTATILTEVKEYRRYSADLNAAWDAVEKLANAREMLSIRREGGRWLVAFGEREAISAGTAAVAICLAALQARGIEVECDVEELERPRNTASGIANAQIKSLNAL